MIRHEFDPSDFINTKDFRYIKETVSEESEVDLFD